MTLNFTNCVQANRRAEAEYCYMLYEKVMISITQLLKACVVLLFVGVMLSIGLLYCCSCYRLAEVGVLETPKLQGKYDTGQVGRFD